MKSYEVGFRRSPVPKWAAHGHARLIDWLRSKCCWKQKCCRTAASMQTVSCKLGHATCCGQSLVVPSYTALEFAAATCKYKFSIWSYKVSEQWSTTRTHGGWRLYNFDTTLTLTRILRYFCCFFETGWWQIATLRTANWQNLAQNPAIWYHPMENFV